MTKQKLTPAVETAPQPSKREQLVTLLRHPNGASIDDLVASMGWLPHTARAMLTGLRKSGHIIDKRKTEGKNRYYVVDGSAA